MGKKFNKFKKFVKKYKIQVILWITLVVGTIVNCVIAIFRGRKNADQAIKDIIKKRTVENDKHIKDISDFVDNNPIPPKL